MKDRLSSRGLTAGQAPGLIDDIDDGNDEAED
jgi:hypothetical protein